MRTNAGRGATHHPLGSGPTAARPAPVARARSIALARPGR